ncbi:hypothetical protein NW762_010856 [Fusarium torreyae]|uniref:MARVEL domain-containing protein n=1 Tax=Fusarium torreyae TaxID=1237075 RepID=A0A9W8VA34_9HYPO|nr:hypothetical protein NW762_010856 [Fusarium torreyae]
MAPESSTQTEQERYAPTPTNPAFPPSAQAPTQTYDQAQQQRQQQAGFQQDPRSYGPPYAPYQQQPPQSQQWTPPRVPEKKAWMITKMVLHGLDIITCIVGLGITGALQKVDLLGLVALASCPLLVVAMIWDIAEFATRFGRKWKAGIHPGAHVALSLLIWLGAAVVGGIESTISAAYSWDDLDESCSYDPDARTYDCNTTDTYSSKRPLFIALSVFTCLVWLWHFVLFVGACIDTQKRNAAMRRPVTMVFGGPAYWGPGSQGFQQMPQYYAPPQGQNIQMQNWAPPQSGNGKEAMTAAQSPPAAERYA